MKTHLGYKMEQKPNGTFKVRKISNGFLVYESSIYQTEQDVLDYIEAIPKVDNINYTSKSLDDILDELDAI